MSVVDYAYPMMMAEKALKEAHNHLLNKEYDEAIEVMLVALTETKLTLTSIKHAFLMSVLTRSERFVLTNDDLLHLVSDPITSRLPICFVQFKNQQRRLVDVKEFCKLARKNLQMIILFTVPDRELLHF